MNILTLILQKIFFDSTKGEPNPRWRQRARKLGSYQEISIYRRRKKLAGYIIHPEERDQTTTPDSRIVIFSHPLSRKTKYFFSDSERALTYLRRGYSVLAFDYNGFGESDSIDLFYWRDVVAIIDHVKRLYPDKKIVLHGASFGAFHIIRALDYLPQGSEVVLENVNKNLLSYWRKWPSTHRLVRLLEFIRLRAVRDMDVQSVVRAFQRPDLHIQFIACEDDSHTTLHEMQELYAELATDNKSFTVFKGAGHLAALSKDPALYQAALFSRGFRQC